LIDELRLKFRADHLSGDINKKVKDD